MKRLAVVLALAALTVVYACKDKTECCPISDAPTGTMNLGGSGSCGPTSDFWCSTNWRKEEDENGCAVWRYDIRAPKPGETSLCLPAHDAGADTDAGADADAEADAAADAEADADADAG